MDRNPVAFLSYVHSDDGHDNGRISQIRAMLESEVQRQLGDESFCIFQDREDIAWGQKWQDRINNSIDTSTFLIPVLTPSFFKSEPCRNEFTRFLDREEKLNRDDLILPIYYLDANILSDPKKREADELAKIIAGRQYVDWRSVRFDLLESPGMRKKIAELASQLIRAIERANESTSNFESNPTPQSVANGVRTLELMEMINFGTSLSEIVEGFRNKMNEFNAIDGCHGTKKYLELGAHIYTCVAVCLDKYLKLTSVSSTNQFEIKELSMRLKKLAGYGPDYLNKNGFPKYWSEGTAICEELEALLSHTKRLNA